MSPPKVIVLGGGTSTERDVSLRSSKAIYDAALQAGYDAVFQDTKNGLTVLDGLDPATAVVLPILHGAGGEDGTIQKELERRGFAYLGADSEVSALCFDKARTRELLAKNGITVAKGAVVNRQEYKQHQLAKKPHVLKVNHGGSSIGTYIVGNPDNIDESKIDEVFGLDAGAVIEELVEGIEITVPILGETAMPVIEIRPPKDTEFDYENKYNGKTLELCPPENVSEELQKQAQSLAEKVHKITGCRHVSRTDMIIRASGEIVVLEINTIPGMTDQSLLPKSAKVAGIDFVGLVKRFVAMIQDSTLQNKV